MKGYSEFGLRARAIMLKKGISATAIAKELGVSNTYVSEILKGTRNGKGRKEQIAKILGMDEELANREEAIS